MVPVQIGKFVSRARMQPELVCSSDIPKWLVDNPYILGWCRKPGLSCGQCVLSVLQLHNQTLNIWTHLAGLLFFQYEMLYAFPSHLTDPKGNNNRLCDKELILLSDAFFLGLAYVGIGMSLLCSVIYHMFNTSTFEMSRFLSQVDYFGIILHLIGCMLALVYFAFYHDYTLQVAYVFLFAVIGVICLVMNYHCMFSSVTNRMNSVQRSAFFSFVVCLSLPPQVYIGFRYSWNLVQLAFTTDLLYVLAATVYSSKCPEKIYPGSFDLFNSHTIFHVLIVAAGYGSAKSISLISHAAIVNYN